MKKTWKMKSEILLFITAIVWGAAFVAQSVGGDAIGCFSFNGGRFLIGGLVLIPVILFMDRQKKKEMGQDSFRKWKSTHRAWIPGGISCGLMLGIGSNFQQVGISMTTVGKAGFITAMYILLVPILGIFLKRKSGKKMWLGVVLAAVGLYLLCMTSESFSLAKGDLLLIIGSFFYAIHIMIVDHYSPKCDGVRMSCVQFLVCGSLSAVLALLFERPSVGLILRGWMPLLYAGVLSCGLGYTLQIVGQKDTNPTVASLILSMESVFSVIAGWLVLNQSLSSREFAGCVLMFAAIVLSQIPDKENSYINSNEKCENG